MKKKSKKKDKTENDKRVMEKKFKINMGEIMQQSEKQNQEYMNVAEKQKGRKGYGY